METMSVPCPPSANFVQNKSVKLYDLDNVSATNTQENSTISFFRVQTTLFHVSMVLSFIMHTDLTSIASAVGFFPTETTFSAVLSMAE